jgi:hypothetical protein
MPSQRPFLLYLRSRLNLGVSLVAGALIVLFLAFLRPYALVPVLVALIAYAAVTGALFFSRRGAREVVGEEEEDRVKKIREKIQKYTGIRDQIAVLRLGDDRMARAIEYFLQESGSYLEKCRELSLYSPLANERIERVRDICQVFLGARDESATARVYKVDAPGAGSDPAEQYAKDITECAGEIKKRIVEDLLGQSGEERLHIMKELEEKK